MNPGQWSAGSRSLYNLRDGVSRSTVQVFIHLDKTNGTIPLKTSKTQHSFSQTHGVQVYPESWTAIYMPLDNVGMWNVRSANWARQYLGQQFYLRVYSNSSSLRDENPIPNNALLCGRALGHKSEIPLETEQQWELIV